MPIIRDQFYRVDAQATSPGTALNVEILEINDNGDGQFGVGDTIDGNAIDLIYYPEEVTVQVNGTNVTYIGASISTIDSGGNTVFFFTPVVPSAQEVLFDGTYVGGDYSTSDPISSFPISNLGPVCFTAGTLIKTPTGSVPVESLRSGDLVVTADQGAVPLMLSHTRVYGSKSLAEHPNARPVRITQGALGDGLPERDVLVSPQHRVLLRSRIVERMYDAPEVLAPAIQLTQMPGIEQVAPDSVTYVHLVFSAHQVVFAESAPMESLLLGPQVHESLTKVEIDKICRDLGIEAQLPTEPARPLVKGAKLNSCLRRHLKNGVSLLSPAQPEYTETAA